MINWNAEIIWENGSPIPSDYNESLRLLYSVFVCIGVFVVVGVSTLKLWRRSIPLKDFINAIYIALPIGIIGGSIFGKLGATEEEWKLIYKLVFFWEPGMSFFGSMLCGGTAAFIWLWHKSKVTRISLYVYADCIAPNILLGQSIGRWGNLFNHEILGRPVYDISKIDWLPDFIWHRLFYIVNPSTAEPMTTIQFHEPLFLYESVTTLLLWILITFVFANFGKWFSKKPWNVDPINFPCKANKLYKSINENEMPQYPTQMPISYLRDNKGKLFLTKSWAWKKAYVLYEPKSEFVAIEQNKIDNQKLVIVRANEKYRMLLNKIRQEIEKEKTKLLKNKISKSEFKKNKMEIQKKYSNDKKTLAGEKNAFKGFLRRDSRALYELNNPNNYKLIHCGLLSGIYIVSYTLLRFLLDSFRNPWELTIKQSPILNYIFLSLFLSTGVALIIFAQFVAPKKWREEGWLYEKSY